MVLTVGARDGDLEELEELRAYQKQGHEFFDKLWKSGMMTRTTAYVWLQTKMKLPSQLTHFRHFDKRQCQKAIQLVREYEKEHGLTKTI
jgi:hypothetical protein